MLVLNGPQGVGKSTLIAKLGGEWFSDSLSLSDTKDKTAAEKLQGYWILEIGELAGLKKAEVETLRSFLSRQNDIYRASFGKRATPHMRQCVFFGTTNAEKGYLRDTTGNRRFWPVKTPGNGSKSSWQITQKDILQIWAEALTYVKAGEKLYLDVSIENLAKDEQREAMESDEREGLVRDYLETLLPDNWAKLDLYQRRNFLNGSEFGESQLKGTVNRTSVSNMEIWCECFGKERNELQTHGQQMRYHQLWRVSADGAVLLKKNADSALRSAMGLCDVTLWLRMLPMNHELWRTQFTSNVRDEMTKKASEQILDHGVKPF